MKKATGTAAFAAFGSLTAFADEAVPDMDNYAVSSMRALSDKVLPWIGVALGLSLLAVLFILIINRHNHKS